MTNLIMVTSKEQMITTVAGWIDKVAVMLTSEAGRLRMRRDIRERLDGGTIETMHVIAAAEAGHADADLALRELIAVKLDRREELSVALANYAQRALVMPVVTYPPGRNIADTWMRDVAIAVMVSLVVVQWGLPPTRNAASGLPSASWIVAKSLARRGFKKLGHRQVGRIYGEHHRLAGRLCASMSGL
jgi:hypothetical protein